METIVTLLLGATFGVVATLYIQQLASYLPSLKDGEYWD